ncbi:hypothetical protein Tco_0945967 [Tanacetum coccineum]
MEMIAGIDLFVQSAKVKLLTHLKPLIGMDLWVETIGSDESGLDMRESGGMRRRCSDARRRSFVSLRYENKWLGVDHRAVSLDDVDFNQVSVDFTLNSVKKSFVLLNDDAGDVLELSKAIRYYHNVTGFPQMRGNGSCMESI